MELSRLLLRVALGGGWERFSRQRLPALGERVDVLLNTGLLVTAWRIPFRGSYRWLALNAAGQEYGLWEKGIAYLRAESSTER